jgi:hypothetical protein
MPASLKRVQRPAEGRLSKLGDEVYVGGLVAALVVIIGAILAYGLSYLVNFTDWVALNGG